MKNITNSFNEFYIPRKALLFYSLTGQQDGEPDEIYIESYDISRRGKPVNAHPLNHKETIQLSSQLQQATRSLTNFLKPKSILPTQVLYLSNEGEGQVIWYTPAQKVNLYFALALGIPCGVAAVPAMVWKADRSTLSVFAIKGERRPLPATTLYHAPFFNIYADGQVCMGTVNVAADGCGCLEDFIAAWQNYFWNSYFSHLIGEVSPIDGNIVQLWKGLVGSSRAFPSNTLKKTRLTLQNIIP